jgi:hypothetical protein
MLSSLSGVPGGIYALMCAAKIVHVGPQKARDA